MSLPNPLLAFHTQNGVASKASAASEMYIAYLGSRNGTRVDGEMIVGSRRFAAGEEIGVASESGMFRSVGIWR